MIIDTHSHFGKDYYCGNINIEDYIKCCKKIGVSIGFLMPSPWPITIINGKEITSLIWEHENYRKKFYYQFDGEKKSEIYKNPYLDVNYSYYDIVRNNKEMNLKFIPLIHGKLDTAEYLESLIETINPPAVKMHNFASGFSIDDINMELMEILRSKGIPIILHTSVYNYNYGYGASTRFFRNECHPYKWAKFLVDNNLKGVLNHGACLNSDAIELVNRNKNLMIGIGPDLDISRDYFKVDIDKNEYKEDTYLTSLKKMVDPHKLLFDIDYNWNLDGNEYDISQVERFETIWSGSELEDLLCNNALNYYALKDYEKKLCRRI